VPDHDAPALEELPDFSIEDAYQEALKLVREGRWTEAARQIELVESLDPDYKTTPTLKGMVQEVSRSPFMGFGMMPAHVAQGAMSRPMDAYEDEEDDYEPPQPAPPAERRVRWPLIVGGVVVVAIVVVAYLLFQR
jgi:hypothetical protein